MQYLLGIILVLFIYFAAQGIHLWISLGAMNIAIILSIICSILLHKYKKFYAPGAIFLEKKLLSYSIMLCGLEISLYQFAHLFYPAVPIIIVMLVCVFFIPRLLGFKDEYSVLTSAGFGICGSNAIAAVSNTLKFQDKSATALSILFTNLIGMAAVLIVPPLLKIIPNAQSMSELTLGTIIGATMPAIAQVMALSTQLSTTSHWSNITSISIAVKMIRVAFLVPLVLILCQKKKTENTKWTNIIPPSLWGMIFFIALHHVIPIPQKVLQPISKANHLMLNISITALGLMIPSGFSLRKIFNQFLYSIGIFILVCTITVVFIYLVKP